MHRKLHFLVLSTALIVSTATGYAKDKRAKAAADAPQDEITLVSRIPLTGSSVTRFLTTQHYRQDYLYAEHESNKTVTLIDVTHPGNPSVQDLSYPSGGADKLVAVTGNAALVAADDGAAPSAPQTFRIMNFADPLHPTVKQEFAGVTAMARDDRRGLIFLANAEGVWILQQHYAEDPQAEKEWEHMMLDNR